MNDPAAAEHCEMTSGYFEEIYRSYFSRMCRFAGEYVNTPEEAENIVQDIFLKLWENNMHFPVRHQLSTYLFTLVKNRCIDFLRHQIVEASYRQELSFKLETLNSIDTGFNTDEELQVLLDHAVEKLPERCRTIFLLSRMEHKKYREIGELLGISENTVETQMKIALKRLRKDLKEYFPLLLF